MTPEEAKRLSRGFSVDMSGEAMAKRIDMVSKLRELGLAFRKACIIGPLLSGEAHGSGGSSLVESARNEYGGRS